MDVWCCLQQLKIFKNNTVKPYGSLKGMRHLRYCRRIFLKLLCKTLLETFAKKPFPPDNRNLNKDFRLFLSPNHS